jgi:sortase A
MAVACPQSESLDSLDDRHASRLQESLDKEFASPAFADAYRTRNLRLGGPFARMRIAKLGIDLIVVEGTTEHALQAGAGHYDSTPFPGEPGNVAITGDRTQFGAPFLRLNELRPGDEVVLIAPIGSFSYRVVEPFDGHPNPWVTPPRDVSVLSPTAEPSLTLTTVDPPNTSENRLIVRLRLAATEALRG